MITVAMVILDLQEELHRMKAEWRFAIMRHGEQCATLLGALLKHK